MKMNYENELLTSHSRAVGRVFSSLQILYLTQNHNCFLLPRNLVGSLFICQYNISKCKLLDPLKDTNNKGLISLMPGFDPFSESKSGLEDMIASEKSGGENASSVPQPSFNWDSFWPNKYGSGQSQLNLNSYSLFGGTHLR